MSAFEKMFTFYFTKSIKNYVTFRNSNYRKLIKKETFGFPFFKFKLKIK